MSDNAVNYEHQLDPPTTFFATPFPVFVSRLDKLLPPPCPTPSPSFHRGLLVSATSHSNPPKLPDSKSFRDLCDNSDVWIRESTILRFAMATRKDNASSNRYVGGLVVYYSYTTESRNLRHDVSFRIEGRSLLRIKSRRGERHKCRELRTNGTERRSQIVSLVKRIVAIY